MSMLSIPPITASTRFDMDHALKQRIRLRAYEIWNAVGRPEGDQNQHWLAAEREVLAASMEPVVRASIKKKATPRKTPHQAKLARARARKMAYG
jgi:hypothetical protein